MGDRSDRRAQNLTAALGFLQLPATQPELQLLHRWLDTFEWRATFMENAMWTPRGFGVAPTPWGAVQMAAWATVRRATGA